MKKNTVFFLCALLCLCLAAGCGDHMAAFIFVPPAGDASSQAPQPGEPPSQEPRPGGEADQSAAVTMTCRIVDGAEEGVLLLADLGEKGVYHLDLTGDIPVYLDGEPAFAADLEDGMPLDVVYDGVIQESYPGQFGAVERIEAFSLGTARNPGGTYYDLCGLYLQVLDDLWQVDGALNQGKPMAGLDLSQAPGGLSDSEQEAIAWRFGELHGVEVITATFDELLAQGHIAADPLGTEDAPADARFYHWDEGCLFSITPRAAEEEDPYSLPVLRFDAEKYASSLGAYIFYDCFAVWPQMGAWGEYQVGSEMVA